MQWYPSSGFPAGQSSLMSSFIRILFDRTCYFLYSYFSNKILVHLHVTFSWYEFVLLSATTTSPVASSESDTGDQSNGETGNNQHASDLCDKLLASSTPHESQFYGFPPQPFSQPLTGDNPHLRELYSETSLSQPTGPTQPTPTAAVYDAPKPYSCQMCDKKYERLTDFETHLYVHVGEKPHNVVPPIQDVFRANFSPDSHVEIMDVKLEECGTVDEMPSPPAYGE